MRHENDTLMNVINLKTFKGFDKVSKFIGDTAQNVMIFLAFSCILVEYFSDINLPVTEVIITYGVMFMTWELYKWRMRIILKKYEGA